MQSGSSRAKQRELPGKALTVSLIVRGIGVSAPFDKSLPIAKRTRTYLREIGLG